MLLRLKHVLCFMALECPFRGPMEAAILP
jgi:hypothetical protein